MTIAVVGCNDESVFEADSSADIYQMDSAEMWPADSLRYDTILIPINPYHYKGWHQGFMQGRDWDAISILQKNIDDSGLIRSVLVEVRRPKVKPPDTEFRIDSNTFRSGMVKP